ncbi:hypothetical protein D3C87_1974320 [compost metagenome]
MRLADKMFFFIAAGLNKGRVGISNMAVDVGGRHQRRLFVKQILALCNRSVISHEKLHGDVENIKKPPEKCSGKTKVIVVFITA